VVLVIITRVGNNTAGKSSHKVYWAGEILDPVIFWQHGEKKFKIKKRNKSGNFVASALGN